MVKMVNFMLCIFYRNENNVTTASTTLELKQGCQVWELKGIVVMRWSVQSFYNVNAVMTWPGANPAIPALHTDPGEMKTEF